MRRMAFKVILFLNLILLTGCFDIFRGDSDHIVGNISVINPRNQEDKGYKLIIFKEEFNSTVIEDYIDELVGNDSLLLIKALNKEDCMPRFYRINHNGGMKIYQVIMSDEGEYIQKSKQIKPKYSFYSDVEVCE
ncbi:hypothetical protein [Flaviaesturariibacter amylovorans]|uniref:Lipoprotein n=1 Tax=Flaviaesturariibacter amylovorans TaxID=1084520 RepID=A0ABP8GB83_9BACT